ncbi:protein-serine/threonine phosphatase [Salvia divinorum]|uniref:Protein-serine/threonine phosphatase n=1 Tax=Salvia divinorum TaxID=28513 RepID=A0ABD1H7Q7_SALDI
MSTAASAEQPHNLASSTTSTGAAVGLSPVPATPLASEEKKKETAVEEKPFIHATNQMESSSSDDEFDVEPDDAYHLDLQRVKHKMQKLDLHLGSENKEMCTHPGYFHEFCITCGLRVQDDSDIPLKYIHENLRVAKDEMT